MFIWCSLLFTLGILAFLDSLFNMGDIFRQINSVLFMLISLGLLIRTTTKAKSKKREENLKKIRALEQQVSVLQEGQRKLAEY
jgi:membrane protein DedA with SNARE-associated domain